MGSKEKAKKEKPLDKMTVKELRELALGETKLVGVHGMNKAELLAAVKEERGIVDEVKRPKGDVRELKKKIAVIRDEKQAALEAGDKDLARRLRRKMSRLKKRTRRAA